MAIGRIAADICKDVEILFQVPVLFFFSEFCFRAL